MIGWLKPHSLRRKQRTVTKQDFHIFWTGAGGREATPDKAK